MKQGQWPRYLAWCVLAGMVWAICANVSFAQASPAAAAAEPTPFWQCIFDIFRNLFDSEKLIEVLGRREIVIAAFVALNVIVFVETGLLIGFFLPGDSLLVIAGIVSNSAHWSLPLLLVTLSLSAIIGDTVGYLIGLRTGPRIFNREKSFFFRKDHLLAAQRFYEQHGGKTILLARFVPIIRTFAPVVAGVGKMDYRRFLFFNIFGGVGWVASMILIGYSLAPFMKRLLGEDFKVEKHVDKVIIVVVLLSISPGLVIWLKKKLKGKPQPEPEFDTAGEVL